MTKTKTVKPRAAGAHPEPDSRMSAAQPARARAGRVSERDRATRWASMASGIVSLLSRPRRCRSTPRRLGARAGARLGASARL